MEGISGGYDCQLPLIFAIFLRGKVKNFKDLKGILCWNLIHSFEGFKISPHLTLRNYPKSSAVQKNHNKYVPFLFFFLFSVSFLRQQLSCEIVTKFHAEKSYRTLASYR